MRFFRAATIDGSGLDLAASEREQVESLAFTACKELRNSNVFYSFAVFKSPALMPDLWTLLRHEVKPLPDGGLRITTRQVGGSTKGVSSEAVVSALGESTSVLVISMSFVLGIPAPDSVLRMFIPLDDEAPRAARLRALRTTAEQRAARPVP